MLGFPHASSQGVLQNDPLTGKRKSKLHRLRIFANLLLSLSDSMYLAHKSTAHYEIMHFFIQKLQE